MDTNNLRSAYFAAQNLDVDMHNCLRACYTPNAVGFIKSLTIRDL